ADTFSGSEPSHRLRIEYVRPSVPVSQNHAIARKRHLNERVLEHLLQLDGLLNRFFVCVRLDNDLRIDAKSFHPAPAPTGPSPGFTARPQTSAPTPSVHR